MACKRKRKYGSCAECLKQAESEGTRRRAQAIADAIDSEILEKIMKEVADEDA